METLNATQATQEAAQPISYGHLFGMDFTGLSVWAANRVMRLHGFSVEQCKVVFSYYQAIRMIDCELKQITRHDGLYCWQLVEA